MAKKNKYKEPLNRILVIRMSSIGDIVLTSPVIRCLRRKYPDAKIDFLIKDKFQMVMKDSPYINELIVYDGDLNKTIQELKANNYQHIIDLHKNIRSKSIIRAMKLPSTTFNKLNIKKWLYTNLKINNLPPISVVERYFQAVEELGVQNDGQGMEFIIPENDQTELEDIPLGHWSGFVAAVIGGSRATRKMPNDKWIEFIKNCKYPVVLMGGKEDFENGEIIKNESGNIAYNSCGKFNLNESADLLKRAKVVITHDTGLMHIAAALQKPIISIWGNTTPELGMFPYYGFNDLDRHIAAQSIFIENKNVRCRPCSKIGYDKCPKKHFKCMNTLSTDQMVNEVHKMWDKVIHQEKSEGKFI